MQNESLPHICKFCNKGFKRGWDLKIHIVKHTGERPYQCQLCEKSFPYYKSLRTHLHSHGISSYTCDGCNKGFSSISPLKRHKQTSPHCAQFIHKNTKIDDHEDKLLLQLINNKRKCNDNTLKNENIVNSMRTQSPPPLRFFNSEAIARRSSPPPLIYYQSFNSSIDSSN